MARRYTLPSGIHIVPRQVVKCVLSGDQFVTVLADNSVEAIGRTTWPLGTSSYFRASRYHSLHNVSS